MDVLLITGGVLLLALFCMNMHTAADVLCRIICGFGALLLYNSAAALASAPIIGVNLITALILGILGLPGGILLLCMAAFLC